MLAQSAPGPCAFLVLLLQPPTEVTEQGAQPSWGRGHRRNAGMLVKWRKQWKERPEKRIKLESRSRRRLGRMDDGRMRAGRSQPARVFGHYFGATFLADASFAHPFIHRSGLYSVG